MRYQVREGVEMPCAHCARFLISINECAKLPDCCSVMIAVSVIVHIKLNYYSDTY